MNTVRDAKPIIKDILPPELLGSIISYFCSHCVDDIEDEDNEANVKVLMALTQTSREFRSVAMPILFHSLGPHLPSTYVLRVLDHQPDLAHMAITQSESIDKTQSSLVDAEMCLAMVLCSGMERLKIRMSDNQHKEMFPNLRHLDIDKTQSTNFSLCDPEPILLLRGAPCLQTLIFRAPRGERHVHQKSDSGIQQFCAGVTNITELQILGLPFFEGDWQTRALERILGAAQNLKSFKFVGVGDGIWQSHVHSDTPPAQLLWFLNPQTQKTLQRLSLDFNRANSRLQRKSITPQQIRQFTSLDTLQLDPSCYCTKRMTEEGIVEQETYLVDFLPQTVQTLTIFLDRWARYGLVYDSTLLAQRVVSGEFPNLKRVEVEAPIWRMKAPALGVSLYDNWAKEQWAKLSGLEVCLAIGTGLVIFNVTLGFGKDQSDVDPAVVPTIALTGTIFGIFGVLSASWSKSSFALTLIRLVDGWMSWFLWFLIISTNIIMDLVIVFSFVKCTPAEKVWHSSLPGTCWNPMVATYYNIFAGAFSGLVDLILCAIAWTIIWKLSIRTREKIGVGIALTFGIFAAAAAAAKCYKMLGLSSKNRTLDRVGIIIWSTTECAVTIMAASIPVMRILILRIYRRTPDQVSNRPLRTLRIISTRDKKASTNNTMPSYNTEGINMLAEDGLRDLSLPSRTISARQNDNDILEYTVRLGS
ncbi:integral membrane protein pth11 [Fusarium denticulatum]|uniref:Integral membrane protein pth11 n=1 Tax=Fusarium denticulatum TaxID=48507 RepID=A0A8H5XKC6_9HYPO|nr:integral membrane protein pth11 [Fusarium denticulatum]